MKAVSERDELREVSLVAIKIRWHWHFRMQLGAAGPSNFVFSRSFPPCDVFRKHWRMADSALLGLPPIAHFKQSQGVARCESNASFPFRALIAISQAEMAETCNATVGSARTPRAYALNASCWPASPSTTQVSRTTGVTAADPKANLLPTPALSDPHGI